MEPVMKGGNSPCPSSHLVDSTNLMQNIFYYKKQRAHAVYCENIQSVSCALSHTHTHTHTPTCIHTRTHTQQSCSKGFYLSFSTETKRFITEKLKTHTVTDLPTVSKMPVSVQLHVSTAPQLSSFCKINKLRNVKCFKIVNLQNTGLYQHI